MSNNDLIDIAGEVTAETEKAYRFFDGVTTVWLPKSQCEWFTDEKVMTIPEWLAIDKDLV